MMGAGYFGVGAHGDAPVGCDLGVFQRTNGVMV